MSEQGYGWWEAADGVWYSPEQHPDHRPDDPSSYGWWQAADGNSYPPSQHPEYRAAAVAPVRPPGGYEPPATTVMPQAAAVPPPPSSPPPPSPHGYVTQTEPPGPMFTPGVIGLLVAAALIVVGSVLPWASIDLGGFSQTINGLDGDGGLTLVLGLIVAGLGVASKGRRKGFAIGAIVAAALSALIAAIDIADVSSTFDGLGLGAGVSVGFGLWLVLVASLGAIAACVKIIIDSRT